MSGNVLFVERKEKGEYVVFERGAFPSSSRINKLYEERIEI
jgi:hypothetical protein